MGLFETLGMALKPETESKELKEAKRLLNRGLTILPEMDESIRYRTAIRVAKLIAREIAMELTAGSKNDPYTAGELEFYELVIQELDNL